MTGQALWWDTPWQPVAAVPADRTDALIIGGGISGVVAGIELLRNGLDVTVLEAEKAGTGASGRAFGSIALGCTASVAALSARYGKEQAEVIWRQSSDAAHVLRNYLAETGISGDYRRTGHVRVAVHPGQEAGLRADYELWRRLIPEEEVRLVSADQLESGLPGAGFRLGLVDDTSAALDPYRLLGELVHRFEQLGGRYCEFTRADNISRQDKQFIVTHTAGRSVADHVLVATDGYTGKLMPWLSRRVYPVGSYIIATEPLPPDLRDGFTERTVTTAFVRKNYFRLTGEGRLLFGGRLNLSTAVPQHKITSQLRTSLLRYFPNLGGVEVTHAWGGSMGFTADHIPHVGVHNGVHYALGYCGRGLPVAVYFGRLMARQALRQPGESQFGMLLSRYHGRPPWALPIVAGQHQLQDFYHAR